MSMTKEETMKYLKEGIAASKAGVKAGKVASEKAIDMIGDIAPDDKGRYDTDTLAIQTRRLAFEIGLWQELSNMLEVYEDMPRKLRKGLGPKGVDAMKSLFVAKILSEMIKEANDYANRETEETN